MNESNGITSMETIVAIVLKEFRMERGIHQAQLADQMSKSASAIAKIENFQTSIGIENLYAICAVLGTMGSSVLVAVERYCQLLSTSGWIVVRSKPDEDNLAKLALAYYASPGFKRRSAALAQLQTFGSSVLLGPRYGTQGELYVPEVFLFALQEDFRAQQLDATAQTFLPGGMLQGLKDFSVHYNR